ncbi:hypothetical protein CLOHYLEM_05566 [[Clostridium] hylemonae DSM 15053]|uniref:Uncharacterized protein n=1 Tax=[Clostridium] hylemonae DSM 15053 TaxID=553973 RepID=C0C0H0_9FIRM|nr:hypothetical protein CLOHYLEM_05566 [[Clostridium] hylemonae DSM 15053]
MPLSYFCRNSRNNMLRFSYTLTNIIYREKENRCHAKLLHLR